MEKNQEKQDQFLNIFAEQQKQQQPKQHTKYVEKALKPQPLADPKLTRKVCELLQQLLPLKQVKKGVNEVLKQVSKNNVEVVVLAADCDPLQIIMMLPTQCQQRNIQYCFVESKAVLGRACGIKRPVVCAAILSKEGSHLKAQILDLKDKIEQLFI